MFNNRAFEEEPVEKEPVKKEPGQQPPRDDPAPEDTTPPTGTIDTLAATDDAAGQLLLTWTAPAAPDADPTDYHVNWAKSAEDYPADTAEAGNAHPTGTTHTLTGLEYDTEYNIRLPVAEYFLRLRRAFALSFCACAEVGFDLLGWGWWLFYDERGGVRPAPGRSG